MVQKPMSYDLYVWSLKDSVDTWIRIASDIPLDSASRLVEDPLSGAVYHEDWYITRHGENEIYLPKQRSRR